MPRNASVQHLYSGKVINAAAASSTAIEVSRFKEATIYIRKTAVSGTSPTLDLDVETSPAKNSPVQWHKDSDVPQITDTPAAPDNLAVIKLSGNLGAQLRLNNPAIPGGTNPSFTIDAWVVLKD